MFSVTVRDYLMIAHSLCEYFGPAAGVHGATYVVDLTFFSDRLNEYNIVVDIGIAGDILHQSLDPLRYRNLDEMEEFKNQITTTEFLARHIHQSVKRLMKGRFEGKIRVTLAESPVASASFES